MALAVAAMLLIGIGQTAPTDPDALVRHYRDMTAVAPPMVPRCETAGGADITVCGRRDSDQRLPLRDETAGPVLDSRPPGEANADCVARTGAPCPVCPPGGCTGVNLLAAPFKLFRIVRAIVDPDH